MDNEDWEVCCPLRANSYPGYLNSFKSVQGKTQFFDLSAPSCSVSSHMLPVAALWNSAEIKHHHQKVLLDTTALSSSHLERVASWVTLQVSAGRRCGPVAICWRHTQLFSHLVLAVPHIIEALRVMSQCRGSSGPGVDDRYLRGVWQVWKLQAWSHFFQSCCFCLTIRN